MAQNVFAVSLNSYTWGRFDLAECLAQIKQTPVRRVEVPVEQTRPKSLIPELMVDAPLSGQWQYSLPDLRALLAADGFVVDSVDVFGFLGYPGGADIIKRRVDFAVALGCDMIVLGCHREDLPAPAAGETLPDNAETRAARAFCYGLLREVGQYAATCGVRLALEVHGALMGSVAEALRTMQEVGLPNVGVNLDTANILFYNESQPASYGLEAAEALAPYITHVHLKDIIRGKQRAEHVLPRLGQGEVDFQGTFDVLHAAGFTGPFSLEVETFHRATQSDSIEDYHADIVASIEYLKSLGELA